MRVNDLIKEVEQVKNQNKLSTKSKEQLRDVLSDMFDVIERFEKNGSSNLKSDRDKIDLLKSTITSLIAQHEREKIIKGES